MPYLAAIPESVSPVSYTHLDVYKRQILNVSASYFLQAALPKKDDEVTITEMNKIRKYRALDDHGKKMVDMILEEEWKRSESEKLQLESIQFEKIRHIQYYQRLASAGTGPVSYTHLYER